MIIIPDVKGKSIRETKNKFDDWGLRYDQVKETYSFNTEKGKVVKTEPPIGSQVNYGDLITVYVSKGKIYPIFIILFAFLLIGLLLGKGTISRLLEDSKKKHQNANVCLLNCDTNGDGIADTNLDTDGDGVCDTNCENPISQDGNGSSTDGKHNENPNEEKKPQGDVPSIKVETGTQGCNTVIKVVETKGNPTTIKYSSGNKKVEYFGDAGTPIAIGEYVIIGNTGTITIYAGNETGGSTTGVVVGGKDDVTPPDFEAVAPEDFSNNPVVELKYDKTDVAKLKVMKGDQTLEDIKADGKDITTKTSYKLDGNGTWTFAAWDRAGNGITETVTYNKYDVTKPSFTIDGDFITPKKTVTAIIQASDDNDTGLSDYFTIYYTNGRKSANDFENMSVCSTSEINNCKFRLTNKEHIGINENDTYTFIVYDKAGNYETSFTKTGGEETNTYLTVENANSELSAPTFLLNNVGWSVDKTVTIVYPDGGLGTYEYSIDGGNTWETYMDPIHFIDDGTVHEVIARVMDGDYALASSSIVVTKLDKAEPIFDLGLSNDASFGLGSDMNLPKSSNKNSLKSGATTTCQYKKSGGDWKTITNIKQINEIGFYDIKCDMVTGAGKQASTQTASHIEVFQPRFIRFEAKNTTFGDDICVDNADYSCNSDRTIATKKIKEGKEIGNTPSVNYDGYTLVGWYLKNNGEETESMINIGDKPSTDQDYYAKWIKGKYTITFDANGGTWNGNTTMEKKVDNGASIQSTLLTLSQPTKSDGNETFVGWYDAPEGGTQITADYVPTSSVTIYAHWLSNVGSDFASYITQLFNSAAYSSVLSNLDGKNIRYISTSAKNYVDIDGDGIADYRIIGVVEAKKENGENANLIKLVSINSIGKHLIDANNKPFEESTLKNTLQSLPVSQYAENVYWSTSPVTTNNTISEALAKEYTYEKYYIGKVGMLYASDIGYSRSAGSNPKISRISSATSSWMLTGSNYISKATFILDSIVQDDYSYWSPYLAYDPSFVISATQNNLDLDIYPVIYLKDGTKVNGGNGSQSTPFGIMNN